MKKILEDIAACRNCAPFLAHDPRPVLQVSAQSKILVIGQAPGRVVHQTGIAWDDKSGDNLRRWMGVDKETFYAADKIALIPMGFCYPGKGKSGDLPPRPECAPLWHQALLGHMKNIKLTVLIGQYAQKYYLKNRLEKNLTESVRNYMNYLPEYFLLPHPSPRNRIWMKKHPWFEIDVLPVFTDKVAKIISA